MPESDNHPGAFAPPLLWKEGSRVVPTWRKVNNVWRKAHNVWRKVENIWRKPHNSWRKVENVWRKLHSSWRKLHNSWRKAHNALRASLTNPRSEIRDPQSKCERFSDIGSQKVSDLLFNTEPSGRRRFYIFFIYLLTFARLTHAAHRSWHARCTYGGIRKIDKLKEARK